jgi:8-amino-7-oxononanoate synthase
MDSLGWIDDALGDLDRRGLRRTPLVRGSPQRGDYIEIAGQRLINFGSNDYLGLAADPEICEAVGRAVAVEGWGAGASPLVTGRAHAHVELEDNLASFEQTEAALVFATGFAANVGAISTLVGPGDAIFSDAKNHASIIDGCRLSGAKVEIYRHRDVDHLRELLAACSKNSKRLIATDGLFSMDGDLAPLASIVQLADEHGAMLMVDEAHATGVFGASGRGACEHLGVEDGVHVRVGTLSKALGSIGGFAAGERRLIDWLANRARTYVFSTALPAAAAAAAGKALSLVRSQPQRRETLLARSAMLREKLAGEGFRGGCSESQIIPVILGDERRTMAVSAALRRLGFFVPGIRPPSVPEGESLLRISMSFVHTEQDVDDLVAALKSAAR